MNGSIHELTQALTALRKQEGGCGAVNPITEERCGEEVTHFYTTLVSFDPWTQGNLGVCRKHHTSYDVTTGEHSAGCHAALGLEDLLEKAELAETKEEVIALFRDHKNDVYQRFVSYMEYADRAEKLVGPGTVAELNAIYEETVEQYRKAVRNK